ncbi:hypothetical protein JQ506_22175 [Shinella sp. PSBB067]|nr:MULTISPECIES: hypothetical protein [unclassified Shinella]QRI63481.1 hypothetical protein JQ506_22175 [Shinella sp. PSBB067]
MFNDDHLNQIKAETAEYFGEEVYMEIEERRLDDFIAERMPQVPAPML